MTITVSLVGVLTIVGRRTLLGLTARRPTALASLSRGLAVAGSALITVIGALFLADAWNRVG